jgi:hypothetical protein
MYKHEKHEIVIDRCSPQNYVLYNSKLCVSMCSSKQVSTSTTFYIDAFPSFLIDSNVSQNWKQRKSNELRHDP